MHFSSFNHALLCIAAVLAWHGPVLRPWKYTPMNKYLPFLQAGQATQSLLWHLSFHLLRGPLDPPGKKTFMKLVWKQKKSDHIFHKLTSPKALYAHRANDLSLTTLWSRIVPSKFRGFGLPMVPFKWMLKSHSMITFSPFCPPAPAPEETCRRGKGEASRVKSHRSNYKAGK